MSRKIAVLVGSLRKESYTRKVAQRIAELTPGLAFDQVEIGALAHYNQDLDPDHAPAPWVEFRDRVRGADGLLFATPEYNRSVPGVLKNAIDVGSRPYGKSVFAGKPGAVVSVTPGGLGAFGANHHLRQSLVFLDVPTLQQPELYLNNIAKTLDTDDVTKLLTKFGEAFTAWVEKHVR